MAKDYKLSCKLLQNLLVSVLCFIIFLQEHSIYAQWAIEDDGCRTPDRGIGTCIVIQQCQPIVKFLQDSPKPLSQEIANKLRSYQCGFEGKNVKVCCPNNGIINNNNVPQSRNGPPNVDNHRNRYLTPIDKCGASEFDDKIINGNKTGLFEYPWMALLSYQTTRGPDFRCGGSIINNRYILTAAHCLTNLGRLQLIGVRVGEHDIRTPTDCETDEYGNTVCAPPVQDIAIEKVITHPEYNAKAYSHDIGLIRLASSINTSVDSVKPICLPFGDRARNFNFTNRFMIVTGWGITETGQTSPDLLQVRIPVIEQEDCQSVYQNVVTITKRQICAGGRRKRDSCGGDSGGPLALPTEIGRVTKQVQHGIVSFGPKLCGLEGSPGVYTKISYYMDWILDTIKP